jgi:hypothetical protein
MTRQSTMIAPVVNQCMAAFVRKLKSVLRRTAPNDYPEPPGRLGPGYQPQALNRFVDDQPVIYIHPRGFNTA